MTGKIQDEVQLSIPATSASLRLARLVAAGYAADLGFSVEQVEDIRVAVDELCAAVIDFADEPARLDLAFRRQDTTLVVEGACVHADGSVPTLDPLAKELVSLLTDDFTLEKADGRWRFALAKLRSEQHGDQMAVPETTGIDGATEIS